MEINTSEEQLNSQNNIQIESNHQDTSSNKPKQKYKTNFRLYSQYTNIDLGVKIIPIYLI